MRIPSTWRLVHLKDIIQDMQPGFAQRPGEEDGSIGQIRTHNVSPEGKISLDGLKRVSPSEAELDKYSLVPGDIVFNNTNSREWVGKTALYDLEESLVFSNHMTRIRADEAIVVPAFLARYLHFLWSTGYSRTRAKRWVSQAAIDREELSMFGVPLATLPEQQRIVDILKQADELCSMRRTTIEQARNLPAALFIEMFGKPAEYSKNWKMAPLGEFVTYSKYGPRFPSREYSNHGARILRTTDMGGDGSIRWWESPILPLTEEELAQHVLKPRTLLVSRSGTIGPVAVFDGADEHCVAGAYLLEFGLSDEINADYVKRFLLSDYGQALLTGGSRGGTQANLNAPTVKSISIPVPPLSHQENYARCVHAIGEVIKPIETNVGDFDDLVFKIAARAFSGEITKTWRESNREILHLVAETRDKSSSSPRDKATKTEIAPGQRPWLDRPNRRWLLNQLSAVQGFVYEALSEWKGTLIPSEDLDRFREECFQIEHLEDANDQIKRALNQLAGLGLIAKISVPNQAGEYVTGYRRLREDELSWAKDLERLGPK